MVPEDIEKMDLAFPESGSSSPNQLSPDISAEDRLGQNQMATRSQSVATAAVGAREKPQLTKTKSIAGKMSLPHEIAFVSIVCMAQFMTQVGLGQVLSIINVIGASFGIEHDPGLLSWLIAGYSLTVGTFILISGRMGDLFGYKRMFLIGFAWFSVWSMICGLAVYSNHVLFVFARVLAGIGPAIIMPNGLAILGATYAPGKSKAMVFAIFGACAPNGSIAGSLFGGLFALAWWPWTFWSTSIALAFLTVAGYFIIPDPPSKDDAVNLTWREKIPHLDILGSITGVTALVLINFAWNQAPIVGWEKAYVYVLLIIGIAFVPVFFYVELKVSNYPLIPFHAFSMDVSFVLACIACGWATFGIWAFYTWQFFLNIRNASPLLATAWVSPVCPSGAIAAIFTGWILGRVRPSWVMALAMTGFTVGTILIATAPVDQTYWAQAFVAVVITPWGMDMSFPAGTLILSDAVAKEHQGIAASLISTVVNYSISLGLGFAGTVDVHVNSGGQTPDDILKGYRGGFYMGIGLAALGMVVSLLYVAKDYWTDRTASKSEEKKSEASDV